MTFLRSIDQIHCINGIDISLHLVPSIWWGISPVVIQEALRNRRPVICSDTGGMAEKVRDGVDGFHFAAGNGMALASLLREIAGDSAMLTEVGAGREVGGVVDGFIGGRETLTLQHKIAWFTDIKGVDHGPTAELSRLEVCPYSSETGFAPFKTALGDVLDVKVDTARGEGYYDYTINDVSGIAIQIELIFSESGRSNLGR